MLENIVIGPVIVITDETFLRAIVGDLLHNRGVFTLAYQRGFSYIDDMRVPVPEKERRNIKGSLITIYYRKIAMDNDGKQQPTYYIY